MSIYTLLSIDETSIRALHIDFPFRKIPRGLNLKFPFARASIHPVGARAVDVIAPIDRLSWRGRKE